MRFLLLLVLLQSCASVLQSGPDVVMISSKPPGAAVMLDGSHIGETPCQIVVDRTAGGRVHLEASGYHPVEFKLPTRVNGTIVLNILWWWGAPVAIIVDVATGNASAWRSPGTIVLPALEDEELTKEEIKEMVKA